MLKLEKLTLSEGSPNAHARDLPVASGPHTRHAKLSQLLKQQAQTEQKTQELSKQIGPGREFDPQRLACLDEIAKGLELEREITVLQFGMRQTQSVGRRGLYRSR